MPDDRASVLRYTPEVTARASETNNSDYADEWQEKQKTLFCSACFQRQEAMLFTTLLQVRGCQASKDHLTTKAVLL
jgi:hypothetical protein